MAPSPADDAQVPRKPTAEKSSSVEDVGDSAEVPGSGAPHIPSFWEKRLPPWVITNLRSPKSLKLLVRCWLASWICFVILLPQRSLNVLGNAAFFGLLASLFIPASMPVQLFLFLLATMVVGLCLGWGFGAAAMRAALAARNQVLLKHTLQQEAQSAAGLSNPDALFVIDIFKGNFLDTNSSIVYGCFFGVACFCFALIRVYAPKLTIMSVFATIAVDILCSYGPLFPFAQYTIINSLLISVGCYVGVGVVLIVLIFPETLNHSYLNTVAVILGQIQNLIDMQTEVLNSPQEAFLPPSALIAKISGARVGIMQRYQQIASNSKFLNLEFSWGKWNGDDVRALEGPLLAVVTRTAAFQSFAKLVGHPFSRTPDDSQSISSDSDDDSVVADTYLLRQIMERNQATEAEHNVRLADIMPVLRDSSLELREACSNGIDAVKTVVQNVNVKRYTRGGAADSEQRVQELGDSIQKLRDALDRFKNEKREQLIEPFQSVLQSCQTKKQAYSIPLRSLYVSFVYGVNLIVLTDAILALMEVARNIAVKRTRNRLWAPSKLRAIGKILLSRGDVSDEALGEDEAQERDEEVQKDFRSYKLDPDSKPPSNFLQQTANAIHKFYKWSCTAEAIFAYKYVIVSIALWLPAVFKSSAEFNYAQKGLWALIMAQTTMNIYASDQLFNYILRLLGTFVGAVVGLLCWYIGSARSNGSHYGAAASTAVFLVPIIFLRLFVPFQYVPGVLLGGATFALVMGYSWVNGHLLIVGNVGIGWAIAWRRCVTVMIGAAASFILMMLPPKSGRKAVRLRNANTITSLSCIYSGLLSAWINDKGTGSDEKLASSSVPEWIPFFREKLTSVWIQLQATTVQTSVARWEGGVRGAWPYDEYMNLAHTQFEMVSHLALLGSSLAQLDRDMRISFLQHTRTINPNFIADVMASFTLIAQSLRTGEPMNQAFHRNLFDRLHYHGTVGARSLAPKEGNEDRNPALFPLESVTSYQYMFYASAIVSVLQLLDALNELHKTSVRLCGEVPLQGFERWKDQFEQAHTLV